MAAGQAAPDRSGVGHEQLRYHALFEWAASGMAVTSLEGRFLAANPALCRMLGYTEDELLELDFLTITHPDDRSANVQLHRRLLAGEIPSFAFEKRYVTKGGEHVWGRVSVAVTRDATDTPLYMAATVEDITAHRHTAEQLELSQSLLRVAGRKARVGGWAITQPGQEVFWSNEMFEILDAPTSDEPPLAEAYMRYPVDDRQRVQAAVGACAREGTAFDLEVQATTFTGRELWVRVVGEADRAEDGTITRIAGAFQDISELKAAHAQTAEVAERLTTSLESMTDAVYLLDREWRFTYLNSRAEQLLRRDRNDLLGRNIWEEFPETRDHPVHDAFHRIARQGVATTLEELYYAPFDTWFSQTVYPSSQGLAIYFQDVTDQHRARVELEERELMLAERAALLDETQEAIFVQDLQGTVRYWNRGAERIYGVTADEAIGRSAWKITAGDAALHEAARCAVTTEGVRNRELTHVTRDGRDMILETRWTLLRDEAGAPRSILVTDSDVTDRRRMERQLIRSQRIESLGTLAGGIAHDLNNVLAPILLATELLAAGDHDEHTLAMLRTIEGSAQRGAAMVRQILSFARGVEGDPADLDVTQVFTDVLRIAAETFPRDIRFVTRFQPAAGWVRGDETQLHQVLMNLLVNARDAMPDGGTITCSVYAKGEDLVGHEHASDVELGDLVVLEVLDDGQGMPPDEVDRAFEPFFTTKPHGAGTGLGLSTSLVIVEGHGGHIHLESRPGIGTVARVCLPTLATHARSAVADPAAHPTEGDGELVLVVDDELPVRAMIQQTLQGAGYRVITAVDGAQAVALYQLRHHDIALVITDLMMPVMAGSEAIDALRSIDPAVRIVAVSGLTEPPRSYGRPSRVGYVLPKPFTGEQLLRATAALLADGQ